MAVTTPAASRPALVARRLGYVIAVLVNAAMLYLINVWPGWRAVPFLTEDTTAVLGLVNASIVVGVVANVAYLVHDAPWLKSLGDLVTTGVGLVVLVRIWRVFPFDFGVAGANWAYLARFVLVLAMGGSVIGIVVQFVSLLRNLAAAGR